MGSLLGDLLDNYIRQAWMFSVLHLLFLLYFLYRWREYWRQAGDFLRALRDESRESDLLKYAREQISRYASQGREPDLPRIERYIAGRFDRGPDTIRPLVNAFVIIGLMGTLFSLFTLGHQSQAVRDPQQILSRMGVAFGTSFFGIVWAMVCSVLLLTPLRRRTDYAIQEVGRRLTELSAEYEPRVPDRAIEELARTLRENVAAFGSEIMKMSEREEAHRLTLSALVEKFSDTTRQMLESLSDKVEATQARTEKTTEALGEAVTGSLESLKARFAEISEAWREEMKYTVESSAEAATRLSLSSQHLAVATESVAGSLADVRESLERTRELGRIAADVKQLTEDYLTRTGEQLEIFREGMEVVLESSRAIPDEWFTMLGLAGDRLAKQWTDITQGWRDHVSETGDHLFTRLSSTNDGLVSVSRLLGPDGEIVTALTDFRSAVVEIKELLAERSLAAEAGAPPAQPAPEDLSAEGVEVEGGLGHEVHGPSNGMEELTSKVEGIRSLLGDFFDRYEARPEAAAVPAHSTQPGLAPSLPGVGESPFPEAPPTYESERPLDVSQQEPPPADPLPAEPLAAEHGPVGPSSAESQSTLPEPVEQLSDLAPPVDEPAAFVGPQGPGIDAPADGTAPEELKEFTAAADEQRAEVEEAVPQDVNVARADTEGTTDSADVGEAEPESPGVVDSDGTTPENEGPDGPVAEAETGEGGRLWRRVWQRLRWRRRRPNTDVEVT